MIPSRMVNFYVTTAYPLGAGGTMFSTSSSVSACVRSCPADWAKALSDQRAVNFFESPSSLFWEITDNIQEMVHEWHIATMED